MPTPPFTSFPIPTALWTQVDPLRLYKGLAVEVPVGQTALGDSAGTFHEATQIDLASDSTDLVPGFCNVQTSAFSLRALHGQGTYNSKTQAKISFFTQANSLWANATGQRLMF